MATNYAYIDDKGQRLLKPSRTIVGDVHLIVEKEQWHDDARIPKEAVEQGKDITDHVTPTPITVSLSGVILWDVKMKVDQKIAKLQEYKNGGQLVTYVGRRVQANMLIEKFNYDGEVEIGNGHKFTMTLTEVRFAKKAETPKSASAQEKTSEGKQQMKGDNSNVHIVKAGDTYIALAKKYGTTWQQLQKLNGYPPTKIPVGAKLKVK